MRVIISSKLLASKLNQFDFRIDNVEEVVTCGHSFHIVSQHKTVEIDSYYNLNNLTIPQSNRRWDHIKNLVNQVKEQPIVLIMTEAGNEVIFQY